ERLHLLLGEVRPARIAEIAERDVAERVAVGADLAIDLEAALELRRIERAEDARERPRQDGRLLHREMGRRPGMLATALFAGDWRGGSRSARGGGGSGSARSGSPRRWSRNRSNFGEGARARQEGKAGRKRAGEDEAPHRGREEGVAHEVH